MSSNSSLEDIHAIIKQKLSLYVDAITAKNIDKMISIFSEDSILIGPSVEAHGREAIKQILGDLIKPVISGNIFSKHIFQITDEIYEMGTNVMIIEREGNEVEIKGNYITVWKKINGEWLITKDMLPPMPD